MDTFNVWFIRVELVLLIIWLVCTVSWSRETLARIATVIHCMRKPAFRRRDRIIDMWMALARGEDPDFTKEMWK